MTSVICLFDLMSSYGTKDTWRRHYADLVFPVCVSNKLNLFWLAVSLSAISMEDWQANLLAVVVSLVVLLATALLLRDWLAP